MGRSGISRCSLGKLPHVNKGRGTIRTLLATFKPLWSAIVTGHSCDPKYKVTASLVIEAL
jgi:hypothetical protein